MKRLVLPLACLAISLLTPRLSAVEPLWRYAVEASATVYPSAPKIVLSWVADPYAVSYSISRKAPTATSWQSLGSLPGSATSFEDTSVAAGKVYEYQIKKSGTQETDYTGYGYLQSAIDAPLVDQRGGLLLVVDKTIAPALAAELALLQQDLAGDGWTVKRLDVGRTDSVASVKAAIKKYAGVTPDAKAVFLFGHVPVPYSGSIAPDGHPSHQGAWPADAFYGSLDEKWRDVSTTFVSTASDITQEERDRLTNVPRDGKYDPSTIPGTVDLQVGRVDLSNMPGYLSWQADPSFPSEIELLRNYLRKDHAYRQRLVTIPRRALLDQFLGMRGGEAFAAAGYRAFSAFYGAGTDVLVDQNVQSSDQQGVWLPALAADAYQWAYGDGGGSYTAVNGLGNTGLYHGMTSTDFVNNDAKAAFVMFFGSWMGDWDTQDNLVRAVLATPSYGLAAVWSGRPHWFFHPLGLGETLGYCARLTQNNGTLYQNQLNRFPRSIHLALHGDPTLRLNPVLPPTDLQGTANAGTVTLTWTASAEADRGYHVYAAPNAAGPYTRLTTTPLGTPSFTSAGATPGVTYMVRAVHLETTASGTYENASQGAFWSAP